MDEEKKSNMNSKSRHTFVSSKQKTIETVSFRNEEVGAVSNMKKSVKSNYITDEKKSKHSPLS